MGEPIRSSEVVSLWVLQFDSTNAQTAFKHILERVRCASDAARPHDRYNLTSRVTPGRRIGIIAQVCRKMFLIRFKVAWRFVDTTVRCELPARLASSLQLQPSAV